MKRDSIVIVLLCLAAMLFPIASSCFADDAAYLIGSGDVLEISVWKDESLSRDVVVPPDGVISFPLVGDINVKNMTVTLLRGIIREQLSEYVPDANVSVILKEINSLSAFVIGKVNKPGQFAIGLDTTVVQVLSMAGGLNAYANGGGINILRLIGGQTSRIPFDYQRVSEGKKLEQNIVVQRGDVIIVP